jgi:hypothetical protein
MYTEAQMNACNYYWYAISTEKMFRSDAFDNGMTEGKAKGLVEGEALQ